MRVQQFMRMCYNMIHTLFLILVVFCFKATLLNTDDILSMLTSIKSIETAIRVFVNEIDSNIHDKCVTGLLKHGLGLFIKRLEEIKKNEFDVLQLYAKKTVLCGNY
jgi:hypothetical protein